MAKLPRLSDATLGCARCGVVLPGYERARLGRGIVHLGLGAFARAHLATYTEDALALEPGDWGITGVSLKRPDQRALLLPQDGLYTTLERDGSRVAARVIGCLGEVIVAAEAPERLSAALRDCRIITLTITEKGYCHDPATGALDVDHPDIAHDLTHAGPRSAIGLLAGTLAARRAAGRAAPTILCCDNLPHNGRLLAGLVRDFAALRGDGLAGWIEGNAAFPSTMVDRIVPAATDADRRDAAALTGLEDDAAVSHEAFRQWVIEDRFAGARPAWDRVGAQIVADVAPYEHMKLRLLNGAHSALAYLGYLAGCETISATMADPALAAYLAGLWAEIVAVVPSPPGVDLLAYTGELRARFANTAIRHRTWQIAMDGSQKMPQRLLATIRERLERQLPIPHLALAVAAWLRYATRQDERGQPIDVRDPLAARLAAGLPAALGLVAVFGEDLPAMADFVGPLTRAYQGLCERGARACAAELGG